MEIPFLTSSDPRLTQASAAIPVDAITGPDTQSTLKRLYEIARPNQSDPSQAILVGLSASQVGIPQRIILIDVVADGRGRVGDLRAFINPVITSASSETAQWYEGCYSTRPVCGIVARPQSITVEAYAPDGTRIQEHFEGYIARVFQHEIDHLDGRIFIDHITSDDHLHWVENHEYPEYRDQEGWRTWAKKFPRSQWEAMRTRSAPAS